MNLGLQPEFDRVLVTGAGSGIGKALALTLAGAGVVVYGLGRTEPTLDATAEAAPPPGRIVPLVCDLKEPAQVSLAFDRIEAESGPVQAMAHCAASVYSAPARALTPEGFANVVDSTLVGAFHVIHRWGTALLDAGLPGTVVSLTSATASFGAAGMAHGSAGKAGLEALTRSLAREWGPHGIRLNVVGPGAFPVENSREIWDREELQARMRRTIALGRYGDLDEIVAPILFFLSRASSYVTGEVLVVDGGLKLLDWPVPPEHLNVRLPSGSGPPQRGPSPPKTRRSGGDPCAT